MAIMQPKPTIGYKLKIHMAIINGQEIEFQSKFGDGRWVQQNGLLNMLTGMPETSWDTGLYRVAAQAHTQILPHPILSK